MADDARPNLAYFFTAYFHQNWPDLAPAGDRRAAYRGVAEEFARRNPRPRVEGAIEEIRALLAEPLDDAGLRRVVVQELHAHVNPTHQGTTYRAWLEAMLEALVELRPTGGSGGRQA